MNTNTQELMSAESALVKFASVYRLDCSLSSDICLQGLSGDAGFRRYFRTNTAPSLIAVDSPPERENSLAYVRTSLLFRDLGVRVPKIIAVDFAQGFLMVEDLGTDLLQDRLPGQDPNQLYALAMEQLMLIQSCDQPPAFLPDYDDELLMKEMDLFREWFLQKLLGVTLDSERLDQLKRLFDFLREEAQSQPRTLVHRDYHARNLMCLDGGDLAVIDFQDAVWGPITYDLVSLGRDCYVRWSEQRLNSFVENCADRLQEQGRLSADQRPVFRRWFDLMGLQRHIKVLGIFARLHLRDGKSGYLPDLPLVLRYTLEVMSQYEECSEIADWMISEVVPQCVDQPWYSDWQSAGSETEIA